MKRIKLLKEKSVDARGKERINILNEISAGYARIDLDECLKYAKMALELSEDMKFYEGRAGSLKNLSLYYLFQGDYVSSKAYLKDSIEIAKELNNEKLIADFNYISSSILRSTGEFEEAHKKAMLAYNYYEKNNDYESMANTLNVIGLLHKYKNDNNTALEYYKRALSVASRINNPEIIGNMRNNIGAIYRIIGEYDKALDFFNKATDYFKDSGNQLVFANALNNISITYSSKEEYENAKIYARKAYNVFKEINNKNGMMLADYNLADICIRTEEYEKAEKLFKKVIKFYVETNDLQMLKNSYFSMYELNKKWKQEAVALEYYEKFHAFEMKFLSEKERKNIAELEAKFNLLQKEKQLKEIKQDYIDLKSINRDNNLTLRKLQANNDFYELILENSHNGITILNPHLNIIYANRLFYKMFDIKNNEANNFRDIFEKETLDKMLSERDKIIDLGKTTKKYSLKTITLAGKVQNLEITVSQFKNSENEWLFLINLKDITESYKRQERLRLLMRAFEQSPTGIAITDIYGYIKYVNPKFTELTGYSSKEVIGKNPRVLKSGKSDASYKELWKTISSGKEWSGLFYNKRKDGSCYWEHASISPVWNKANKITHYIKIAEDITEKKKAEEKIQNLLEELRKANASKDKFFSIIAHDLKSPFATLSAFVNIMKKYYDKYNREQIMHLIDELDKSTKNTYSLLENLLTWSRMQSGGMQYNPMNFNLTPIIVKIVNLYAQKAEQKKIVLSYDAPEKVEIFADMFMIETTVRNLVNNALKFTPKGGSISVIVKKMDKFYEVTVKDTGVGISQEGIKNLFNIDTSFSTYGTDNEKGTGLGLILCKDFVERNHGKIWVESEEDKGTTFYLTVQKNNEAFLK